MGGFATTRWTLVQRASDSSHPDAAAALEQLCRVYWPPVYVFFRRKGSDPSEATDLTQEFFTRVLEKRYFDQARQERGTFRTFLLTCAKNFLANQWDRKKAQRRGGAAHLISLDQPSQHSVEERYQLEPHHNETPERIFEQHWAWSVVQQALTRLEEDVREAGRGAMYAECRDLLLGGPGEAPYREIAQRLNLTEGALKVQVHRLRRRLRELVLEEIAQTAAVDADVQGEFRYLLGLLARPRE